MGLEWLWRLVALANLASLVFNVYFQLWKTAAPKQIESQNSIWAHFEELGLYFKTSPG